MNYQIGNPLLPEETVTRVSFVKVVDVNKEKIFNLMASIEDYPKILPKNYVSVSIINRTDNTVYAEEEVTERGIKTKLLVKHTIIPYEKHILEVIDGDARGTIITVVFEETGSSTKLITDAEIILHGSLVSFSFIAPYNLEHAMDTAITGFVEYAKMT